MIRCVPVPVRDHSWLTAAILRRPRPGTTSGEMTVRLLPASPVQSAPSRVVAVLGPTNTGKTHLAVERMLGHASGMIGLPLRLLAREIYDRIVRARGARSVALITGEEKIVPPRAQLFRLHGRGDAAGPARSSSWPSTRSSSCADPERGHVFTHRLLHARGRYETMFLGAATMAPLIRRLLPGRRDRHPRAASPALTYDGAEEDHPPAAPHRRGRLLRRRGLRHRRADPPPARRRGGGDGHPQPRTRNAQVALYQSGEVDFLVATDAIGMGLNMDVGHVAFAGLRQVRRPAHAAAHRPGGRPDRRPRRPLPPRRHLRRHRRLRRRWTTTWSAQVEDAPLRAGGRRAVAQRAAWISPRWPTCCARWPRRRRARA